MVPFYSEFVQQFGNRWSKLNQTLSLYVQRNGVVIHVFPRYSKFNIPNIRFTKNHCGNEDR